MTEHLPSIKQRLYDRETEIIEAMNAMTRRKDKRFNVFASLQHERASIQMLLRQLSNINVGEHRH
jgi:hypothetical protein